MPLTSMLKITKSTKSATNPEETKGKASSDSMFGDSMVSGDKATN